MVIATMTAICPLREAREEIGLDPDSVHVIGALPAIAPPAAGFLVTPVLAWSSEPRFLHAANPAEVAVVHRVPVIGWKLSLAQPDGLQATGAGPMTATVLDHLASVLAARGEQSA